MGLLDYRWQSGYLCAVCLCLLDGRFSSFLSRRIDVLVLPPIVAELMPAIVGLFVAAGGWGLALYTKKHAHDRTCSRPFLPPAGPSCGCRAERPRSTAASTASILLSYGSKNPSPTGTYRSEEHPSELQSLMSNSYAVFCL